MEKIKIDYTIPESKKDITLEKWLQFQKLVEGDNDEEFIKQKMLEIFCGIPLKWTLQMKQVDIDEIHIILDKVFSVKSDEVQTFVFNGVKYGRIPDFDNHITQGELIDLDKYLELKDYARYLSILYRPITKEAAGLYQIEPYSGTHIDFLQFSYDIFEGVNDFFLRFVRQLPRITLNYSQKELLKMKNLDPIYLEKVSLLLSGVDGQKLFG